MLRPMTDDDLARVHALNEAAVPAVGTATPEHLARLAGMAALALVAEQDGEVVGFALVLGANCAYDSPNYRFFDGRHERFTYIDRIAIDPAAQGTGLGRAIYEDVLAAFPDLPLCAEVNVRPRNDASLAFHDRLGFVAVGEQDAYDGQVRVRLLERPAR